MNQIISFPWDGVNIDVIWVQGPVDAQKETFARHNGFMAILVLHKFPAT